MARKQRSASAHAAKPSTQGRAASVASIVADSLAWLEARGSATVRETIGPRYGITTDRSFGVAVGTIHELAKDLKKAHGAKGTNLRHTIAEALWDSGWYEARLLAAFIDEPSAVTVAQMNRWAADFDNWAICDTACFHLFDRTPHALGRITAWACNESLYIRRAAFALIASVALHDKNAEDSVFTPLLPLIDAVATDDRNFVKKAVSWALRGIGKRNASLRKVAVELAKRLSDSEHRTRRWIGKDALRDLVRVPRKQAPTTSRRTRTGASKKPGRATRNDKRKEA